MAASPAMDCPIDGVVIHALTTHRDPRGDLTEIYRANWELGCQAVQFNVVTSAAGVLRGVHVHVRHVDHLIVAAGAMTLGLHDMRPWSPSAGRSWQVDLEASRPCATVIPPGVAHGFYFPVPSLHVYGVSDYWNPADEISCAWDCAELGIAWPTHAPTLSERDAQAPRYSAFVESFRQTWRSVHGALPERSTR